MRSWNRKPRLSSWASELVPLPSSPRSASTLSKQASLRRLPVPELKDTVDRYLRTLEPIYTILASRGPHSSFGTTDSRNALADASRARQLALATDFLRPGGLGETLQVRLQELDRASPHNWLNDTIWTQVAYHQQRAPLLIHSNWWLLLQDDTTVPAAIKSITFAPSGTVTKWQLRRSAWLTKRFLDYRDKLESQEIHPDSSRTGKWLRAPALRLYGTTRIPLPKCDALITRNSVQDRWILVMFREWTYRVAVYDDVSGIRIPVSHLEAAFSAIVQDVREREQRNERCVPVGRLTADDRDTWALNRDYLVSLSHTNAESLRKIESCLFTLSLDDYTHQSSDAGIDDQTRSLVGHIRNISSGIDSTNRWFDKSMSLIVESNSRFGMMGEHSPVDALIPSIIADYAVSEPIDERDFSPDSTLAPSPERLDWSADSRVASECEAARTRSLVVINDSDSNVLRFDEYGIQWIKENARLSPDAYIQMALQLAWYKSFGSFTATYETASTRLFLHGRTETIRTLSVASIEFVNAMMDPSSGDQVRYQLLREACVSHNHSTKEAALGRGVDRHLLGLRLQLRPGEHSEFLSNDVFQLSQEWKLSTSGLSAGDRFLATGFGTVYEDGYGINYLTGNRVLKFGIESKRSSSLTSTSHFMQLIAESLRDMRDVCINGTIEDGGAQESFAARL